MSTTDRRDVIDALSGDHRAVEDLLEQLDAVSAGPARLRKSLVDKLTLELAWHCEAEQRYLLPLERRGMTDGDDVADGQVTENIAVEELLKDLEAKQPSDARFEPLLAQLMALAWGLIEREQQVTFVEVSREVDHGELMAAGERLTAARVRVAARARPTAAEVLSGAVPPSIVERIHDALSVPDED